MAEPQDITRSPNLLVTLMSWAEAGGVVEPSAGRKSTGEIPNDLYTSNEHNWLGREPMRWLRALFSRYLSSGEALVSSWFVDKGTGIWSDDAVGPLEGFLSDGPAGTASLVTDLWLDPDGTGGVRVQVNAAKASPAQFLANKDTYIFVPIDLIVPPTVSEPELALLDVTIGFPPPATPAGFVLVWRVETDGAGIVGQEIFLPDFPVLKQVGFEIISAAIAMIQGDLDVGGNVEIQGTLDVTGNSILGVDEVNVQQVHGAVTIGTDTTNTTTVTGAMNVAGNSILGVDETNVQQVHGNVTVGTDVTNTTALEGNVTVGTDFSNTTTLNGNVTIGSASSNTPSIKGNLTIGSTNLSLHEVDGVMTFNDGAIIENTAVLNTTTLKGPLTVLSAISGFTGGITSDSTAVLSWSGAATFLGRLNVGTSIPLNEGDLTKINGYLQYQDSSGTGIVHSSQAGFVNGFGESLAPTAAANIIIDTSAGVAPLTTATNLKIVGTAWVQRDGAGDCTVSIEELGGSGQLGTADAIAVPADLGTDRKMIIFTRIRSAADTTPRIYRFKLTGGGPDLTVLNGTITVTEAP